MTKIEIDLPKIKCLRCNYEWTPRGRYVNEDGSLDIRSCPRCRSPYFSRERTNKRKEG